jgi:hypothetical protein
VEIIIPSNIPANFECWVAQLGAGKVAINSTTGATVANVNSYTCTGGAYSLLKLVAISDGVVYITGDGAVS